MRSGKVAIGGRAARPGRQYEGYLFVLPALLFLAVFVGYPVLYNLRISFYAWDGLSPSRRFVGLANYDRLLQDPVVPIILRNTALLLLVVVPISLAVGLALAGLLDVPVRLRGLYRAVFFTPVVIPPIVLAVFAAYFLEPTSGAINRALRAVGLGALAREWTGDPGVAIWSVAGIVVWQWLGYAIMIYLATLQAVPREVREAAQLDGAGPVRAFLGVVVPMLRGAHATLLVLYTVGVIKVFELVWIVTRGGPGDATQVFSTRIYAEAFLNDRVGYAGALAVVLAAIGFTLGVAQLSLYARRGRW